MKKVMDKPKKDYKAAKGKDPDEKGTPSPPPMYSGIPEMDEAFAHALKNNIPFLKKK